MRLHEGRRVLNLMNCVLYGNVIVDGEEEESEESKLQK